MLICTLGSCARAFLEIAIYKLKSPIPLLDPGREGRHDSRMQGHNNAHILLIGAGKMGGALLAAWRHKHEALSITVLESDAAKVKDLMEDGVNVISSLAQVKDSPDCIVLAVKPQGMDGVLKELSSYSTSLILSIAAGKTLAYFAKHLGDAPVVRAMPNTPALIRKGITALVANRHVGEDQKALAEQLLSAAGEVVWLDAEAQIDAVTAVSGSGPAYVFYFLEALIKAGGVQGLPEDIARRLALQTLRGSVKLAMKSEESLEQLRRNVTSPGGTTEAALKVLMRKDGLEALLNEAVAAAVKRSEELA